MQLQGRRQRAIRRHLERLSGRRVYRRVLPARQKRSRSGDETRRVVPSDVAIPAVGRRNCGKKMGRQTQGSPPSRRPVSRPLQFPSTVWPQSYPRHKRRLLRLPPPLPPQHHRHRDRRRHDAFTASSCGNRRTAFVDPANALCGGVLRARRTKVSAS